jgi:hypothetical protein
MGRINPDYAIKRNRVFRHNSYIGYTAMTRQQMLTIIGSDTTTDESAELAKKIALLCIDLKESLKTRVD